MDRGHAGTELHLGLDLQALALLAAAVFQIPEAHVLCSGRFIRVKQFETTLDHGP